MNTPNTRFDATLPRKGLLDALQAFRVAGAPIVATKKGTVPILGCVWLDVTGPDEVTLSGTDLDLGLRVTVACQVHGAGSMIVAHDALVKAVKAAKGNAVRLSDIGSRRAGLAGSTGTTQLVTHDSDPLWQDGQSLWSEPEGVARFDESAAVLKQALDCLAPCVSTDPTRYYLHGALFQSEGEALKMVATDGHSMAVIEQHRPVPAFRDAILPRAAVEWIRRRGVKFGDTVSLGFTDTRFVCRVGHATLIGILVDGTYPDYMRVVRAAGEQGHLIVVDADALGDAVRQTTAHSVSNMKSVLVSAGRDWISTYAKCVENGTGYALMENRAGGLVSGKKADTFAAGFNAEYLIDLCDAFAGQCMTIAMTDATAPARITSDGVPGRVMLLMPLRVDSASPQPWTPERLRALSQDEGELAA